MVLLYFIYLFFLLIFVFFLRQTGHELLISAHHHNRRVPVSRYGAVQRDGGVAGYGSLMHPGQTNKTEALRVIL